MAGTMTMTAAGFSPAVFPTVTDTVSTPLPALTEVALASGDNTITVPSGATRCMLIPPSANTNALKLKGAAADTGVGTFKTAPQYLAWDGTAPASIIVNAAAAGGNLQAIFA